VRILRLIATMDPRTGGPSQGIRNIIPEMTKLGFISEVVCLDDPESSFLANHPFRIYALGSVSNRWSYSKKLKRWLGEHLAEYDSVIIHGLWLYPSYVVSREIIRQRKKGQQTLPSVFIMPHGMLDPYFQRAASRKIKAIRNLVYWALFERKVISMADGLLFTCKKEMELAATSFVGYKPRNTVNIGYGIATPPSLDSVMAEPDFFACFQSIKYLLFLGRIDQKKGLDILLKAYSNISLRSPSVPFLVIAGPVADHEYYSSLTKMVSSDPTLKSKVMFAGMLTGIEKWASIYGCQAFILPSHQENFGIAVVEALACGKPVLVSDQVNISDEIRDARAGFVNPDTTEGTLNGLMQYLALSEAEKMHMGRDAYELYLRSFQIKDTALKLAEILTSRY